MTQLSQHFKRSEFSCHCGCGYDAVNLGLIPHLEILRAHFATPVQIVSGCRCVRHNAKVGGSKNSQHLQGNAADVRVRGVEPSAVADFLEQRYPDSCGIGRYDSFTHFDIRTQKARWNG